MVDDGGGMEQDDLVIFNCGVGTRSLEQGCLHKESCQDGLLNVCIVVDILQRSAVQRALLFGHDPDQLVSHIVRLLQSPVIYVVVPAPVGVRTLGLERVEQIQKGEVVAIWMSEIILCSVGCL